MKGLRDKVVENHSFERLLQGEQRRIHELPNMPPQGEKRGFQRELLNPTKSETNKLSLPRRRVRKRRNLDTPPTSKKLKQIHGQRAFKEEMITRFNSIPTIRAQDTRNVNTSIRKVGSGRKLIKEHSPKKDISLYRNKCGPSGWGGRGD
ncbi:hypothetical protein Tco_1276722 [Tanacetum coccineum]